ncbi:cytochrome b [Arenimonas soli]|uniref:Cytochrome b n=1 Tax=Arenimonas soli TaxID=2269504 RepID=A0ABQ1HR98_9GAMM|nr:cytochrome b [Arenimonas soli]GGA85911.1 cytochrome b [Arenimonas soli]
MPIRNTTERWGWVSISIHWLTVLMVLSLVVVGLVMQELANSPTKIEVYALHKSFGLTVFALTVLRLLWRLFAGTPAAAAGVPRWQQLAAQASHAALYVILLAMPLSGWLYNSASGFPLKWFGLFGLPKLSGYDPDVKAFALAMHEWLFIALAVIVTVHAAAALKHHYFDRDATLSRMLPGLPPPDTKDT